MYKTANMYHFAGLANLAASIALKHALTMSLNEIDQLNEIIQEVLPYLSPEEDINYDWSNYDIDDWDEPLSF
jgi:hypothetical protein